MQSTRDSTAGQRGPAAARTPDGGPVGAEGRSLGEEVVPEGLKLWHKDQGLQSYSYTLFPNKEQSFSVNWRYLSMEDEGMEYIRLHEVAEGQGLADLLQELDYEYTKAVALVNTEEHYELPMKFVADVDLEEAPVPLLVVTRADGEDIARFLMRGFVFARVDARRQLGQRSRRQEAPRPEGLGRFAQFVRGAFTGQSREVAALMGNVQRWMFSSTNVPMLMTKNKENFFNLMFALHNYEATAKEDSVISDVVKKFKNHMARTFKSDFPFYILLLYRLQSKVYDCDEIEEFTRNCLKRFEYELMPRDVSSEILSFIEDGDFSVNFDSNDAENNAFHLYENACFQLAEVSCRFHQYEQQSSDSHPRSQPLHNNFLYSTMLWVSIGLKFHEARQVPLTLTTKWKDFLLQFRHSMVFSPATIAELTSGLQLVSFLGLPAELTFNHKHLGNLMAVVKPFNQLKGCLEGVEKCVDSGDHLLALLTEVRKEYDRFMKLGFGLQNKLKHLSVARTVKGAVKEGIEWLDVFHLVFFQRSFEGFLLTSEIKEWLKMLIQLVEVTGERPADHFKVFINRQEAVLQKYRCVSKEFIIEACLQQFHAISLQQFLHLYKSFDFWTSEHVLEFLKEYMSNISGDIMLSDPILKEFFATVLSHEISGPLRSYLVKFVWTIGRRYQEANRPVDFVVDLLKFEIGNLLPMAGQLESQEERKRFINDLRDYVKDTTFKHSLVEKVANILVTFPDEIHQLQLLVLEELRLNVLPELKISRNKEFEACFKAAVRKSMEELLHVSLDWLPTLSIKRRFFWGILVTYCCKITISEDNLDWTQHYFISKDLNLGLVFKEYCRFRRLSGDACIVTDKLPGEVQNYPSKDLRRYFEWVGEVQRVLQHWRKKFCKQDVDYNTVLLYDSMLLPLGDSVCASTLLVDVKNVKMTFLSKIESLSEDLLLFIPGQPEWCTLPGLLEEYGVCLPQETKNLIAKKVSFPDPSYECQVGDDISLRIHPDMGMKELTELVKVIRSFQKDFFAYRNIFVFFKLKKSVLFHKYLWHFLEKAKSEQAAAASVPSRSSGFNRHVGSLVPPQSSQVQGTPMPHLLSALQSTRDLIEKVMSGTASYSEITVEGELISNLLDSTKGTIAAQHELMSQQLDLEREFDIFLRYGQEFTFTRADFSGMLSMLELVQYKKHVDDIWSVCNQYLLESCTGDALLKELTDIVEVVKKGNTTLTPMEAQQKMARVKEILHLDEGGSSKWLYIFAAAKESAAFYQFVKDKKFDGPQGMASFVQQYQLITAQLQHEEYDEQVLNHLRAAFKVISSFTDSSKSFICLMEEVSALNAVNSLNHLQTVNANIVLIRLWFSTSEGDTLENVAQELDCIIETGCYKLQCEEGKHVVGGEVQKYLEYHAHALPDSSQQGQGGQKAVHRVKNTEQVRDFHTKLGFLNRDDAGGDKVKDFLHLSQTASKLFELYLKLLELGHPEYLTTDQIPSISCSHTKEEIEHMVQQAQCQITMWNSEISDLRAEYTWLLYFSVPKIMLLYDLIRSSCEGVKRTDEIVHEVSFLTTNRLKDMMKLRGEGSIEGALRQASADLTSPMPAVGVFLNVLFENHPLLHQNCGTLNSTHWINSSHFVQPLYSCLAHSQLELVCLILHIFPDIPEAHKVVHCTASTTEEELSQFLKRAEKHHGQYLMLDVNKLPFKLQENLVQVHCSMQRSRQHAEVPVQYVPSTIHFVETAPSILHEMPWILPRNSKDCCVSVEEAKKICKQNLESQGFLDIEVVYGMAGNGKTHYIKKQLADCSEHITIAVNEGFSPLTAIKKLRSLPLYQDNIGLFFNITILPPGDSVHESERKQYHECMEVVGWFFFDLLLLGYVEDSNTGFSFRLPGGLGWSIYIEVPSCSMESDGETLFFQELPILTLFGSRCHIGADVPYDVDGDVQLVCKYLKAYKEGVVKKRIDRLYIDYSLMHRLMFMRNPEHSEPMQCPIIKFSTDPDLSNEECHSLLQEYMPPHVANTKIIQQLFVRYMKRRCEFLDCLPAFNYNAGGGEVVLRTDTQKTGSSVRKRTVTDTQKLGSTLMHTMLKEVSDFCDPTIKDNWSLKPHQQLIYDFKDGGGSIGFISLNPTGMAEEEKEKFERIGIKIPSNVNLYSRGMLDEYLSRALNVGLEKGRLTAIDDSAYVLTLDYTLKMLNIHERYMCGVPVIIEGETGVGKTALVEMLSKLWNQSLLLEWKIQRSRLLDFFRNEISNAPGDSKPGDYEDCLRAVEGLFEGEVSFASLLLLCNHSNPRGKFYSQLKEYLQPMRDNPVVPLLLYKAMTTRHMVDLFDEAESKDTPEATAELLLAILQAQVQPTFHKINVHAALTPTEVKNLFEPVLSQARSLKETYNCKNKLSRSSMSDEIQMGPGVAQGEESREVTPEKEVECLNSLSPLSSNSSLEKSGEDTESEEVMEECLNILGSSNCSPEESGRNSPADHDQKKVPFVTVFLDEVNTSSCLGLFKEIVVDRSLDGETIPDNVFIVAACNPHRGNSMASHERSAESWIRGTYYVRPLHPTLNCLKWDYGSLDEYQERDYIKAKMLMVNRGMSNTEVGALTNLIVNSQKKMREFASRQLKDEHSCRSCVSQRDIQRVFTFYQWLKGIYDKLNPHGGENHHRRAVLVALGLVYYMRLNAKFRKEYSQFLDGIGLRKKMTFSEAFSEELDYYISQVDLPKGIARTLALKENLFATIVCTATHTPLIIVGAPGSSKTLSFNLTIANLQGQESKVELFRDKDFFHSLDPHHYQCSHHTTSKEIEMIFSHAIKRQRSHFKFNLSIYCVVFMDEAGLPEESHESLKVLHYYLDRQEVSFVAITNHMLDAAKTNRAVSLFRPQASNEDLETLAKGCLCSDPENPPAELQRDLEMVVKFCKPYSECMKDPEFSSFFGLRDFIHFVNYLRRKRDEKNALSQKLVMEALERNFNFKKFEDICRRFLAVMGAEDILHHKRHILTVLQDSMQDRPQAVQDLSENEVRYKLLIDPSEDDSLVRLLFSFDVLERQKTRIMMCSDFPENVQIQKINTIAAIRHSAIQGHTVVMSQTDDIHESFYDLFNQRFRRIDDSKDGARYYANIAIGSHSKPSRVHPDFQCVVVVKQSEVAKTPLPFLNRFEKYLISHASMLGALLEHLPAYMAILIKAAKDKVQEFINSVPSGLYGHQDATLDSLILSFLPSPNHVFINLEADEVADGQEVSVYLYQEVLKFLKLNAGFYIPEMAVECTTEDASYVYNLIARKDLTWTHQDASGAAREAFKILYSAPEQGEEALSPRGCLVVSLLQQAFVRLFIKKLMNLMTTEAVILYRNKIPSSYLENYLRNQAHFSLKEVITKYHTALKATQESPNKLVLFTRSSSLLYTLPAHFPHSTTAEAQRGADTTRGQNYSEVSKAVANLVFDETGKLILCKLSGLLSQTAVEELLRNFVSSDAAEVCVLLANTQDTTRKTINHIRVMIEEAELKTPAQCCKMFVLLLHFPPAQFFQHCYPSLFLKGWDHCYLDTLAHSTVEGGVNIEDWLFKCCFPTKEACPGTPDTLLQTLTKLLPQAIPIISARVTFGKKSDDSFNSTMNATQRSKALHVLLFERGVGDVLCEKFRAYWKPKVIVEYLEKAAMFSKQRESTLNITDAIQTQFKALFMDFCVYMIAQANEKFNLDIAYAGDTETDIHRLFLDLFKVSPVPQLHQLNWLCNDLPSLQPAVQSLHFPFFTSICEEMEKRVELSREAANLSLELLANFKQLEARKSSSGPSTKLQALIDTILDDLGPLLQEGSKSFLKASVVAMGSHENIWKTYFIDFVAYKLKLGPSSHTQLQGNIAQQILYTYFEDVHRYTMPRRLVLLHCNGSVKHLFLSQLAAILRPLNKIGMFNLEAQLLSPLLDSVQLTGLPLGSPSRLSDFVIKTLFCALAMANSSTPEAQMKSKLGIWFRSYRYMMSMPTLRQQLYSSLSESGDSSVREAMMNVMQATFVTQQSSDADVQSKSRQVFNTLFSHHFKEAVKEPAGRFQLVSRPGLAEVVAVAMKVVSSSGGAHARFVVESLFAHFFSPDQQSYAHEDVLCFLKLANQQELWCHVEGHSGRVQQREDSDEASTLLMMLLPEAMEINLMKFHLSHILKSHEKGQPDSGPLLLYQPQYRALIGEVLMQHARGSPGPYVPLFYQIAFSGVTHKLPENCHMPQPLCHLYFLTVMERLWTDKHFKPDRVDINHYVQLVQGIQEEMEAAGAVEAVLLHVELQSVIQVLIEQLALHFDPSHLERLGDVQDIVAEINCVFDDPALGMAQGHGMVLAMHLEKLLRGSQKFLPLMTTKFDNLDSIQCVRYIHEKLLADQNGVLSDIRLLDTHYPHFPVEKDFTHIVQSSGDLDQSLEGGSLWLLSLFTLDWQYLEVGGSLLPSLVEFYQWLHSDLAYLLTRQRASSITIGKVVELAEGNLEEQSGKHIRKLYGEVKDDYNLYVELMRSAADDCTISDDIPILDYLTDDEKEGRLYLVIADIISTHNHIIQSIYSMVQAKQSPCYHLFPEKPAKISLAEVTSSSAIVSNSSELHCKKSFLQLIRSRYLSPVHLPLPFDLERLQEDLLSTFIVGKPLIDAQSEVRTVFKFKETKQERSTVQDNAYTAADIQNLTGRLEDSFKDPLPASLLKSFEYEFHSADYHLMIDVVTALRTILGHLVKTFDEGREPIEDLKALQFMRNLHDQDVDVLQEIGLQGLSQPRLDCLTELPLTATYDCLSLFFRWVEEGFYDFSTLPFQFKVHMSDQDRLALKELSQKRNELQRLIDMLKFVEQDVTSQANEAINKPILDYLIEHKILIEHKMLLEGDTITRYIPKTILLHHYVEFRLALRRLKLEVPLQEHQSQITKETWSEVVADLWTTRLHHLSEEQHGDVLYNPEGGGHGFQAEREGEDDAKDDANKLETAISREGMEPRQRPSVQDDAPGHFNERGEGAEHRGRVTEDKKKEGAEKAPTPDLKPLARQMTADDVANFLRKIGLPQYSSAFKKGKISGEVLPDMDVEGFSELGVDRPLHRMKIMELFPRELQGTEAKYSNDHLSEFLRQLEMIEYIFILKKHGIDGDMILHVEINLMKTVLKEIGVTSSLDRSKICTKYKTYVETC